MKCVIRIVYEHSVSTQETFNEQQCRWAVQEIMNTMFRSNAPRIVGFQVQYGNDRKQFFSNPKHVDEGRS